jgi:hypothetical protein
MAFQLIQTVGGREPHHIHTLDTEAMGHQTPAGPYTMPQWWPCNQVCSRWVFKATVSSSIFPGQCWPQGQKHTPIPMAPTARIPHGRM